MKEVGASHLWSDRMGVGDRWGGGTRMGADPRTSVVNPYCQVHDVENLFIVGSSVFPTTPSHPPTPTVGALAYRTADYVKAHPELFA